MKITCNSCGSKYTIADAKVQGKKVKVRCKGCKESILVDGTSVGQGDASVDEEDGPVSLSVPAAAPQAPAPVTPGPVLWSVNISDDDSREMSIEELRKAWADGVVTSDAYVWKDGMGDWKPILEVGELKHKLGDPPKKAGVVSSAAVPAIKPVASGIGDLFGADAASGGGSGGLGGLGGLGQPEAGKPTGARNDSSVLFSLDSLTSNADGSGNKARANAADIFGGLGPAVGSLGANPDLLTAPAKDPPPAPAGFRSAGLDPAASAAKGKGKGGLIAAILGAAVIVGGGFFYMGAADTSSDPATDEKLAAAQATAEEALKKAEEAQKKAEEDRKKMEADLKAAREEAEKKGEDPDAAADKKKAELQEKKEEPKEEQVASSSPSDSTSPSPAPSPAPAPKPAAGPGPFNVSAARSALGSAAANAASCKKSGGPTGSGKVQVTFATSGRVTSANVVSGPFGGTAVGGCVASTFRRAKVPAFSGGSQTVSKSFKIP